jgi:hypothetical protein
MAVGDGVCDGSHTRWLWWFGADCSVFVAHCANDIDKCPVHPCSAADDSAVTPTDEPDDDSRGYASLNSSDANSPASDRGAIRFDQARNHDNA